MSVLICTYPRSGSRYLASFLQANTDLAFERSHSTDKVSEFDTVITTLRDPASCFKSQIVLEYEFQKATPTINRAASIPGEVNLDKAIASCVEMYKEFYDSVLKVNPIVLTYETISDPALLTAKIDELSKELSFNVNEFITNDFSVIMTDLDIDQSIFASSQNSEKYQEISDFVDNSDIQEAISLYEELSKQYK